MFVYSQLPFNNTWSFKISDQNLYYHEFICLDEDAYNDSVIPCELLISEINNSQTYSNLSYSDINQQHFRVEIFYDNFVLDKVKVISKIWIDEDYDEMEDGSYKSVDETEWKRNKSNLKDDIDELQNPNNYMNKDIALRINSRYHRTRTSSKCSKDRQQIMIKILKNIPEKIGNDVALDVVFYKPKEIKELQNFYEIDKLSFEQYQRLESINSILMKWLDTTEEYKNKWRNDEFSHPVKEHFNKSLELLEYYSGIYIEKDVEFSHNDLLISPSNSDLF
jgi:hypothetical protein